MRWLSLALAAVLLAPVLIVRSTRLAGRVWSAGQEMWADDYEQRRLDSYGYCDRRGYGYVRRVLRRFPDADAIPRIHYGDTERYTALLLPELRPRLDPRVFIGINLDWRETRERIWPMAADPARAGAWRTRTIEFDLLTGIQVGVADAAGVARTFDVTLYETPNRRTILGRWTVTVPAGARTGTAPVDPPLEHFSIRRGAIDFVLDVAGAATVSAVSLAAVPIDARGLVVIQREGSCLTAVTPELVRDMERGSGPWAAWLADLRGPR